MENQTIVQSARNGTASVQVIPAPTVDAFIAAVRRGVESWEEAGGILVQLAREDKNIFRKIAHDYPFITIDTLEVFHHIGTKSLYPMTVLLPRHVFPRVREMSYETQKKVCSEPVSVVTRMSGDKPVVIEKGIAKLTADEARKALCRRGNRSVEKQVKALTDGPDWATFTANTPKPVPATAQRLPKSVGLYSVRRGIGGKDFVFEKTTARPYTLQKIILQHGQAVIELTEYDDTEWPSRNGPQGSAHGGAGTTRNQK